MICDKNNLLLISFAVFNGNSISTSVYFRMSVQMYFEKVIQHEKYIIILSPCP